jgi:large subunit ribosomal protein L33
MAKKNTILVKLTSTGINSNGNPTGTIFVKKRNPKKQTEKLSFRKYDPKAVRDEAGNTANNSENDENDSNGENGGSGNVKPGMHVVFVEKKMPNPKAN